MFKEAVLSKSAAKSYFVKSFRILVGITFSFAIPAFAEIKKPLLYKFEKHGKSSYLFGTIHSGLHLSEFPLFILRAIDSSDSFIGETSGDVEINASFLQQNAFEVSGPGLSSLLSEQEWNRLVKSIHYFNPQIPVQAIDRMKPFFALVLYFKGIETKTAQKNPLKKEDQIERIDSIEDQITTYISPRIHKKSIRGLEKPLNGAVRQTIDDLRKVLNSPMTTETAQQALDLIGEAYGEGDLALLEDLVAKSFFEQPEIYKSQLVDRNQDWLPKIERIHLEDGRHFFFVGAAHLVGTDGLLKLLEAQGFQIKRIEDEHGLIPITLNDDARAALGKSASDSLHPKMNAVVMSRPASSPELQRTARVWDRPSLKMLNDFVAAGTGFGALIGEVIFFTDSHASIVSPFVGAAAGAVLTYSVNAVRYIVKTIEMKKAESCTVELTRTHAKK